MDTNTTIDITVIESTPRSYEDGGYNRPGQVLYAGRVRLADGETELVSLVGEPGISDDVLLTEVRADWADDAVEAWEWLEEVGPDYEEILVGYGEVRK